MKRLVFAVSILLAVFVFLGFSSRPDIVNTSYVRHHHPGCTKLFTVQMGKNAANAIYGGTKQPTSKQLRLLGRIEHCQRNPRAKWYVRWYDHHQASVQAQRIYDQQHPLSSILVSWYTDGGATASGTHYYYAFASCGATHELCVPWGTRVEFYYNGASVIAQADDHGPYSGSRGVDLNQNAAAALPGFEGAGVATVSYRILG